MENLKTLTLDSREVAKMLPKSHAHLLRDIATYSKYLSDFNERNFALVNFFQKSSYQDSKGETRKRYLITKKGCEFIAHKMTGKKGALFTATYINRFHEMEAALKHPKPAVPATVMNRRTWNRNIVMTSMQLQQLTGINRTRLRTQAIAEGIKYFLLTGVDAKTFFVENNIAPRAGRIIIYPQGTVLVLLRLFGVYNRMKEYIDEYFQIGKYAPLKLQDVDCNTEAIWNKINNISEKLLTMNGLLKHIPDFKRKPEAHAALVETTKDLGLLVFQSLQDLQQQIQSLEA